MSWLALLFIGVGLSDLVFSVRPQRIVPEVSAAILTVLLGLGCGLTEAGDVVALLCIAGFVVAWGQTVTRGFGPGPATLPLLVLGVAVLGILAVGEHAEPVHGPLGRLFADNPVAPIRALGADRALLLLGVGLMQLSTGNVIVRLVLRATGSRNPSKLGRPPAVDHGQAEEPPLKGGRLLGPMERVVIVGLGLAGQLTAASVVIAAKGLLRYPELQAARSEGSPDIHELTEYFLVGSFVSWLLALGSLAILLV